MRVFSNFMPPLCNYYGALHTLPSERLTYQFFLYFVYNRNEDALKSFEKSLVLLRGNKFVDYRQLGFNFQLFACEVRFSFTPH